MSFNAATSFEEYLGPLLDPHQVQTALDSGSRLLVLSRTDGRKIYPAFQFGQDGHPYPEIEKVLEIFEGTVESPYTVASWFVSPQDLLEDETPATWMRSRRQPELLLEAARRVAAKLAR